jgi:anti-anti-sigma factor
MLKDQSVVSDEALVVRTKQVGWVQVIALRGRLGVANCGEAEAQIETALDRGRGQVVVDTRELEFIDSTGVALLVAALSSQDRVKSLRFIPSLSPAVARVLEAHGIDGTAMLDDPRPAMKLRASGWV